MMYSCSNRMEQKLQSQSVRYREVSTVACNYSNSPKGIVLTISIVTPLLPTLLKDCSDTLYSLLGDNPLIVYDLIDVVFIDVGEDPGMFN